MSAKMDRHFRQILGVRFFVGKPAEAAALGLQGGLVVVPAAPALVDFMHDTDYQEALDNSDLAITDSGLMVLIWSLMKRDRICRTSGLEYLKLILADPSLRRPQATFWIMPTRGAAEKNAAWLRENGLPVSVEDYYVAPKYTNNNVADPLLLEAVNRRKPPHIIIALGGGVQEKLGYYLKRFAEYRPGIHCIGAAIAFLSGDQVRIPAWADRLFLGWLFRCAHQPAKFVPRYWKGPRLLPLMMTYQESLPEPAQR
jgi:UDP-N-acetyl-D-mannosaminuronic acid transferase (WecB/TagA/CpsF family)